MQWLTTKIFKPTLDVRAYTVCGKQIKSCKHELTTLLLLFFGRASPAKGYQMLSIEFLKTSAHKANAIDKRAIANLRGHLQTEIYVDGLNIDKNELVDECNYIIVKIEGYENIAFCDYKSKCICRTVQPIDRENNKLFPVQEIEIKAQYRRF